MEFFYLCFGFTGYIFNVIFYFVNNCFNYIIWKQISLQPPLASSLIIELRGSIKIHSNSFYYIRFRYVNESDPKDENNQFLWSPFCGNFLSNYSCFFDRFVLNIADTFSKNIDQDCAEKFLIQSHSVVQYSDSSSIQFIFKWCLLFLKIILIFYLFKHFVFRLFRF